VCHTEQECHKNPASADKKAGKSDPNSRRLKAAKLAAAVLEGEEDVEEDSEDDDN
jgi:hypothetical protein